MRSRAGLRRASSKKTENIKSVHYLLCFKHIQPLSKSCFLVTFPPKHDLRASPEGVARRGCQMMSLLHPKIAKKKGPRRSLDGPQDGPKIHPKSTFLVVQSLRAPTSDLRGAWRGVPEPISFQKSMQNYTKIDKKSTCF